MEQLSIIGGRVMVFVLGFALVLCLFIIYWQSEFIRNLFHKDCYKCSINNFCLSYRDSDVYNYRCVEAYKKYIKEHWL